MKHLLRIIPPTRRLHHKSLTAKLKKLIAAVAVENALVAKDLLIVLLVTIALLDYKMGEHLYRASPIVKNVPVKSPESSDMSNHWEQLQPA